MLNNHLWLILAVFILASCATPSKRTQRLAEEHKLTDVLLEGDGFFHRSYYRPATQGQPDNLRVYIEGDGLPWRGRYRVSDDPTPRNPLALKLMLLDRSPALYLGRPCYYAPPRSTVPCEPRWWTHRRYSAEVVNSMVTALRRFLGQTGYRRIELIGYSGGGTLATLMAPHLDDVTVKLVTVAGNLSLRAWENAHGYTPLEGSLDPIQQMPLNSRIRQLHFLGEEDRIIPGKAIEQYAARQKNAAAIIMTGYDHVCCWEQDWPDLLQTLQQDGERFAPIDTTKPRRPLP